MTGEVIRLASARARKVQQRCNKASREARKALRVRQAREFPYIHPQIRAALVDAELVQSCVRTPELSLAVAMWGTLPDDRRVEADLLLERMAAVSEGAAQAFALVKRRTIGEQVDLRAALDLLAQRG